MNEQRPLLERIAQLEGDVLALTVVIGVTAAALDRPMSPGQKQMTWTEAMLQGMKSAEQGGYRVPIFDVLRQALEIGSEPPPTDDGGSRAVQLFRKAA